MTLGKPLHISEPHLYDGELSVQVRMKRDDACTQPGVRECSINAGCWDQSVHGEQGIPGAVGDR